MQSHMISSLLQIRLIEFNLWEHNLIGSKAGAKQKVGFMLQGLNGKK